MNKTKSLRKQNNLLDKEILPENQEIFTDIICYLRGANISEYEIEVVRHDLTEMVLSAQSRGENITTLFNGDYKQFCDDVIESLSPRSKKQKILENIDIISLSLSLLFFINIIVSKDTISIIEAFIQKKSIDWNISISIGSTVSVFLIIAVSYIVVNMVMKNTFDKEIKHKKLLVFLATFVFMIVMLIIGWLGRDTLFTINIFVALAVSIALFVVHKIIEVVSN